MDQVKLVFGWVGNTRKRIIYTVQVDEDRLKLLAIKAAGNKSKRAVDGPITVVVTNCVDAPEVK